jgi:hypothetical protein
LGFAFKVVGVLHMRFELIAAISLAVALSVGIAAERPAQAGCVDLGPPDATWKIEQVPSAPESRRAQEQIRKQTPDTHDKPLPNSASSESRASKPEPC